MKPLVIVTPYYTHTSNGIRALHHLCHEINQRGHIARLLFLTSKSIIGHVDDPHDDYGQPVTETNPEWNTPCLSDDEKSMIESGIVLYPEVVHGNPLKAPRVIRWMGNKEGVLREDRGMESEPTDFILAHSKVLRPNADHYLYYSYVNPCFNRDDAPPENRIMNATYIGKGYLYGQTGIVKKTLWIDRRWPCTQEQLAFLLKHVACFYTWDSWSQTNVDAILCGCVPFYVRYDPFTREEIDQGELGVIPRLDEDHKIFDLETFERQRAAIIARIAALQASWPERVNNFIQHIEERFRA